MQAQPYFHTLNCNSSISRLQEEKIAYRHKIAKMEAEMKALFNQKVQEKEKKLKESESEVRTRLFAIWCMFTDTSPPKLYSRHREAKDRLEKQLAELEDKRRKAELSRINQPEKPKKKQGLFK